MHFAARYIGKTYREFVSDYRVLVESNLRCLEDFDMDAVGLISDPYRETSAFGAKVTFPEDSVPQCLETLVKTPDDIRLLKNPDVYKSDRTRDRINGAKMLSKEVGSEVPVIGWVEGHLAEAYELLGAEIVRCGNLDPVSVIQQQEASMVTERVRSLCEKEKGRRFVISGGCEITVNTPVENLRAMRDAC